MLRTSHTCSKTDKMGKALKYASLGLTGGIMAMILVISFIEGDKLRKCITCKKIEVNILDSLENNFVSTSDVRRFIDRSYGEYIGFRADSIDLVKIEDIVNSRSAVLRSDAYMTKDGTLHIDVTQRKPVVRFQKEDGGFYADADGYIFPLQSRFASHVQIIDGNIPLAANSGYKGGISDPQEKEWFGGMMSLVNYIENSKVWKGKKMSGRYGNEQVTIQNLKVVKVDLDRNVLLIKGAVPGSKGTLLTIKEAIKG